MKILLLMDPGIAVPPPLYGGHERLVALFAAEYRRLGHEVTLLAGPDSEIEGQVYPFGINNLRRSGWQRLKELLYVWVFLRRNRKNFELIHNFGRLLYLLPVLKNRQKKIMTYGRQVSPAGIKYINKLRPKNLVFTACSNYCTTTGNVAGTWKTIYNAIDFSKYQLNNKPKTQAPLMFLGRLDKVKGLHTAIKMARITGHVLWIGGNLPETPDNLRYYRQEIDPQLDGRQIIYLGALTDQQKNHYLGQAKALLFPIAWNEPFGLVMIEAMACGTPVIGFNKGAVAEVIDDKITGFVVESEQEMADEIGRIGKINRSLCRKKAMEKFDVRVIAQQYLCLFESPEIR